MAFDMDGVGDIIRTHVSLFASEVNSSPMASRHSLCLDVEVNQIGSTLGGVCKME